MSTPVPTDISNPRICEALAPFGISPTGDQVNKIRGYLALLLKWNRTISLTSITDPFEIIERHFGESMYVSKLLPMENCRLADVGTGAGFPGLALKITCPGIHLMLIESNRKKCAFLSEIVRNLELADVVVFPERFEEIRPETVSANIITSRAVGEFKELLQWSTSALARRGHIALWVGADDATRIMQAPGWTWQPPMRIPNSQRRFILLGRPLDESSTQK
jgi:16S rRNA (guanine527-N7)-methyltransferase